MAHRPCDIGDRICDLFGVHRGRVKQNGAGSLLQRRDAPVGVGFVPLEDLIEQLLIIGLHAAGRQFVITAPRAHLGLSRQKHLDRRIWENDRAHIAPVGHQTAFESLE